MQFTPLVVKYDGARSYDATFQYIVFIELMRRVEETSVFWHERDAILRNVRDLFVLVAREPPHCVLGFFMMNGECIEMMQSFPPGRGYGRIMVEYIRGGVVRKPRVSQVLSSAIGFWKRVNVPVECY